MNLEDLSKQQLIELVRLHANNTMAMDGLWFQSMEKAYGMDMAMEQNRNTWTHYARVEAKRIKRFLQLSDLPGLSGLREALTVRYNGILHTTEFIETENSLIFRILDCKVQTARKKKGMPFHPCLSAALVEYSVFASTIDSRIKTTVMSCFPQMNDESCSCSWKFEYVSVV